MPTAKKLPSGNYRVRVFVGMDGDKKIYESITAPTKKEAEYQASQIKFKKNMSTNDMTLKDAAKRYIEIKENVLSYSTIAGYEEIVRNRFINLQRVKLPKIDQIMIDTEVSRELAKVSSKTIKNAYGFYNTVIKYFLPYSQFKLNIPRDVKKEEKHIPTYGEFMCIAQYLHDKNSDFEVPYLLMGMTGLRASEVRAINPKEDIDIETGTLRISKASVRGKDNEYHIKTTKTKSSTRILIMPDKLKQRMKSDYTLNLTNNQMHAKLQWACHVCGIEFFTPHALRHFYVSVLHQIGIPETYGMRRTGHTSLKMYNENYNHQFSDFDKIVDQKINNFFNV